MDMIGIKEGSFEWALMHLKNGAKIQRKGWNGKGMYVEMHDNRKITLMEPYLTIKNVRGSFNTWVPSIADLFAEDWEVVQ